MVSLRTAVEGTRNADNSNDGLALGDKFTSHVIESEVSLDEGIKTAVTAH